MSKKINNTNEAITTTNEVINETPTVNLEELMNKYPNVSLRKLALSLELSYGWILKCSKKPIPGLPYDPDAINYDEVAKTFARKGIDLNALDWETLNESSQTSRGITLQKDMSAFQVGGKVYLREDNEVPFDICYKTDSHIVIMKEGSTEPRAWSHSTFLMKGPVFEPRTIHDNNMETTDAEDETVQDILNDFIGGDEA
jgi:hypothetical protein